MLLSWHEENQGFLRNVHKLPRGGWRAGAGGADGAEESGEKNLHLEGKENIILLIVTFYVCLGGKTYVRNRRIRR